MSNLSVCIMDKSPISGDVVEYLFNAVGDCTWIMFSDDLDQWVGVFGKGSMETDKVVLFDNNKKAFVISGGQGYVINLSDRSLVYMTSEDYLQDAIETSDNKNVIACNFTDLFMYNADGLLWHSDRVARDGIMLTHASKEYVYGKLDDMSGEEDCYFSLNIETKKIQFS